eukprot:2101681-Pleurochrysis_carterae.AAC.1
MWGDTPIFGAAVAGQRACLELLLSRGADLYHRNRKGKSVADAVVDELRLRKPGKPQYAQLASCLELIVSVHARNVEEAEARERVTDIEAAAAAVINPGCELHTVHGQLIPMSSRYDSDLAF